jgi:hypothetical protein
VVEFTIGSRGKVPGKPVKRGEEEIIIIIIIIIIIVTYICTIPSLQNSADINIKAK